MDYYVVRMFLEARAPRAVCMTCLSRNVGVDVDVRAVLTELCAARAVERSLGECVECTDSGQVYRRRM